MVRLRYPPQADRLKEIVPHLRRLAFIYSTIGDPKGDEVVEGNIRTAASRLGFGWQVFRAVAANDYDDIFAASRRNILMLRISGRTPLPTKT